MLVRKVFPKCVGNIRRDTPARLCFGGEGVHEQRIWAYACHHCEIATTLGVLIVAAFDNARGDGARTVLQLPLDCRNGMSGDLQVSCERVGGAQRNYSQRCVRLADHALQDIMNGAITTAGKYGIESALDGLFGLSAGLRRPK